METVLSIGLSDALVASVLALVAVLVSYFVRRPALTHGFWLLVLLKLLTPPLVPIPIAWPAKAELEPVAAGPVTESSDTPLSAAPTLEIPLEIEEPPPIFMLANSEPTPAESQLSEAPLVPVVDPTAPFPWQPLVGGVWLAGSASWFLLAGWRVLRFRRLLRFAAPAPESLRKTVERLARKMQLPSCPGVFLLPGRLAPMLWAIGGKPLLLVPRELLAQLTHEQQETLLAHELAHLRRRDHWVRGLEFLVMGLYWWHPVVWYACRALREAEEQCCDAWVVSLLPGTGRTYATALLETLDFLSNAPTATPVLASGVGQVSDLKRRLTMIMCGSTPRALTWRGTLAVLTLGLFVLPLLPTLARAQTQEIQEELTRQLQKKADDLRAAQADKIQAELEQTRAEMAKLQQQLQDRQNQIKKLEMALAGIKAKSEEGTGRKIVVAPGQSEKAEIVIVVRKVGDKWLVVPSPGKQPEGTNYHFELHDSGGGQSRSGGFMTTPEGKDYRFELKDGNFQIFPVEPGKNPPQPGVSGHAQGTIRVPPMPQPPGMPPMPMGPGKPASENRLDDLEKQLRQVVRELEMLRQEMKAPRPGRGFDKPQPEAK